MKQRAINLSGELLPPSLVGVMILLDRSGSMADIKAPMEKAFADFVDGQRAENPDGMWVTLHQFNSSGYKQVYDKRPLAEVGPLELKPSGGTPLRDALFNFCENAHAIVNDASDQTERLLLVVITDGKENSSTKHTWAEVREALHGLESDDCEVIWLGTSAAVTEAQDQMVTFAAAGAALDYQPTEAGVAYMSGGLRAATAGIRGATTSARASMSNYVGTAKNTPVDDSDWQAALKALTQARKK